MMEQRYIGVLLHATSHVCHGALLLLRSYAGVETGLIQNDEPLTARMTSLT